MSAGEVKKSGLATAGLVLGIIGVVLSFIPIINNVAFVLGIIGLIFGIVALSQRRSKAFAIAAVVLSAVAMVLTIGMQAIYSNAFNKAADEINKTIDNASGANSESILANDLKVEFGTFSAVADEYGLNTTKLPVTVTNKTGEKKSYTVQVEAVDANGVRVLDETIYANDLNAGQAQVFDVFTFVQSDKIDALKAATFKVVSASKV